MSEQTDTPQENTDTEIIYHDQRSVALRTPQSICFVKEHDKASMLELLLNDYKKMQVVIVVKSKKKADALSAFLTSKEFNALSVHGNHRQEHVTERHRIQYEKRNRRKSLRRFCGNGRSYTHKQNKKRPK